MAMNTTIRSVSLAGVLFLFWLALSGHYTLMLVTIGAICAVAIAGLGAWMAIVDKEGHPIALLPRALLYWPWLAVEIVKSAWTASKIIVDPKLPISPTLIRIRAGQKSALGVNIYANSITLTPGTITVEAEPGELLVHAITKEGAEDLARGIMERKVVWLEGG